MVNVLIQRLNKGFDRLAQVHLQWHGRAVSSFHVCGLIAFSLGVVVLIGLTFSQHLELWVMGSLVVVACGTFLLQVVGAKIILGYEWTTQLEHLIAILLASAALCYLLNRPVLPYLDTFVLVLGLCVGVGGMGCLMVGCCHGRPSPVGICYGAEHTAHGFPLYYVGTRLFPIQAVESGTVFSLVLIGGVMLFQPHKDGDVLAWFAVSHGITRFILELFRGDPDRPWFWRLSESQWLALLLVFSTIGAEMLTWLPLQTTHVAAGTGLLLFCVALWLLWHSWGKERYELFHPRHVRELLNVAALLQQRAVAGTVVTSQGVGAAEVPVATTSRGLTVSLSVRRSLGVCVAHYALSRRQAPLSARSAQALAGLILGPQHLVRPAEMCCTEAGVTHFAITTHDAVLRSVSLSG